MKAAKIVKYVLLAILVIVVLLIACFYLVGEKVIKGGVESAASKALGVGVTVGNLKLALLRGYVGINDLIVKNPAGYANANLMELSSGNVTTDIGSLLSDTVKIKQIKLDGLNLVIEQKGLSNNLQDILKSMPKQEETAQPQAKQPGKKLQIDDLELSGITVKVKLLPIPGKADTVNLKLAPITMTNLGQDNKLTVEVLTAKIMAAIAQGVAQQGKDLLPADMTKTLQSTLDTTFNLGKGVLQQGQGILKQGTDSGSNVVQGLQNILKKK